MITLNIAKKWMAASEARKSIETGGYFQTLSGGQLYIVSEAAPSAAGKVRFNYKEINALGYSSSGTAYLEGLTRKVKQVVSEGQTTKVTIPSKVDNSQAKGEHKVTNVSASLERQNGKAVELFNEAISLLVCSSKKRNSAFLAFEVALSESRRNAKEIADFISSPERKAAQAEARRKAAENAKKEAEAKRQAEEAEAKIQEAIKTLVTFAGMTKEQAEIVVRQGSKL